LMRVSVVKVVDHDRFLLVLVPAATSRHRS
jgi:hypothetical protein